MYYKTVEGNKEFYLSYRDKSIMQISLHFNKENKALLDYAEVNNYYVDGFMPYKLTAVSYNDFENAFKKAVNHLIRRLQFSKYILVDTTKLHKQIQVDFETSDDPELKVIW